MKINRTGIYFFGNTKKKIVVIVRPIGTVMLGGIMVPSCGPVVMHDDARHPGCSIKKARIFGGRDFETASGVGWGDGAGEEGGGGPPLMSFGMKRGPLKV